MSNNFNITILNKTKALEDYDGIKVFIDGFEIKPRKESFNYTTSKGVHTLRIEQKKLYKNKYSYVLAPIYLILIFISGNPSILDFSPLYAKYEAEIYLDKDINIDVSLNKNSKRDGRFKKVIRYYLDVIFNNDIERNVLKNEFLATTEEKIRWFIVNSVLLITPIVLIIYLISLVGF